MWKIINSALVGGTVGSLFCGFLYLMEGQYLLLTWATVAAIGCGNAAVMTWLYMDSQRSAALYGSLLAKERNVTTNLLEDMRHAGVKPCRRQSF